jgi:hypothetical protein
MRLFFWAFIASLLLGVSSQGQVVFSQNFDAGGVPGDYDDGVDNEFNGITSSGAAFSWTIDGSNRLQATRTGNAGALSRTTDLSLSPNALYFQFDFDVLDTTTTATSAITISFGSGFGTGNSVEANANTHSRFTINLNDATTESWQVRDVNGGATFGTSFTGSQKITFVTNNSGTSVDYGLGAGVSGSLADDTFDLWVGNVLAFDNAAATTASLANITDFKIVWTSGSSTAAFDNFALGTVPEPGVVVSLIGGAALLAGWRRMRRTK